MPAVSHSRFIITANLIHASSTTLLASTSLASRSVDDVDLYAAGVSENHVSGGMVGPTFACIIAKQYRNLRVSDRFWFERPDPKLGFTPGKSLMSQPNLVKPEKVHYLK